MKSRWTALTTKIHPIVPISPQESRRLLALINTSFDKELSRCHPTTVRDHTSHHVHSILSNPLFNAKAADVRVSSSTHHGNYGKHSGVGKRLPQRPEDLFRKQIAAGTATLQSAILCLQAVYRFCRASPTVLDVDEMRTSRIGKMILYWLWSSGTEEAGAFLENSEFVRLIVPFMVAEKRHKRIWHWFETLLLHWTSAPQTASMQKVYSTLLLDFVSAEITVGEGPAAAIALFVRSVNKHAPMVQNGNLPNELASWYLTTVLKDISKAAAIQDCTITSFMEASGTLSKPITLLAACHWVHVAKTPDPSVALRYFESHLLYDETTSRRRQCIVLTGLKAAELLIEGGRQAEALWIADHLQNNFSQEVGSLAASDRNLSAQSWEEAEERSLRSLDALAIY